MTRIAFFGHNVADAAVRRRVRGFEGDGFDIVGFMMRRGDDAPGSEFKPDWKNYILGTTYDGKFLQRVGSVFSGAELAAAEREELAKCDVIYARNLEMVALAFLAKRKTGLKIPVIYECLDVHRLLSREDALGLMVRGIEGSFLPRTRRLVVSSPGFIENHFERRFRGRYKPVLVENRLAAGEDYGQRPSREAPPAAESLRIGWIGILRCKKSLGLLVDLAKTLGPRVQIVMHGKVAKTEIPDFDQQIQGIENVQFHGKYRSPEDLSKIYSGLDLIWAGDFMEKGYNSDWLLPNRLYEGGYYAVPPITVSKTETDKWARDRGGVGFTVDRDNLGPELATLVAGLLADRTGIPERRTRLLDLPDSTFIQPRGELRALIEDSLRDKA